MNDLAYWTRTLLEAEQELEAATTRSALNAATNKLMQGRWSCNSLSGRSDSCGLTRLDTGERGRPSWWPPLRS
jgi:hypothetical protein